MNTCLRYALILILAVSGAAAEAKTGVNLAPVAEPSTSHVSRDTSLAALHDGQVPQASDDRSNGSYGNWRKIGTQWVQYDWAAPVRTGKIDVFWWDDHRGVGLPKASRLLYWDGKAFVPVRNPSGLGVAKDQFNTTTFDEVRTTKLRLEIDSTKHSTGILEWKVYNEGKLPNFPPSVTAGGDRIAMRGQKTAFAGELLRAISTASTKVSWSKSSGPGKVAFADAAALATTATFSTAGDYVLTLTARKGKMSDSSTLAVRVVGRPQLDIRAVGRTGVRITIQPHDAKDAFPYTPALVERDYPKAAISLRELDSAFKPVKARVGDVNVTVESKPLSVQVATLDNRIIQTITFAPDGTMSFALDDQPVLGMGEGGPKQTGDSWRTDKIELDRRGRLHPMTPWYGTGTYGSANPVPLMIGTAGWGMFIPTPSGAIDLSDSETGSFIPADPIAIGTVVSRRQQRIGRIGLPPPEYFIPGTYDVFVFDAQNPAAFMKDISTISGQAVLPPKWVMGYQQSHRTMRDEAQMLGIIDTFKEKQIPLDSVCYLGTGFCPRGWNKNQPSFEFNPDLFKREPKEVLADMHDRHVKVMAHMIPWDRDRLATIQGTIPAKPGEKLDNTHIQNYWNEHNALVDAGVDAWWPDEGDWFNFHERMKRHEVYYTGALSKQPNVRPWSLHRNGYLGVARWGGWMWPGDPLSTWRTLQTHIAIGINHSLSVSPFWNSDIGAFYTVDEYSAELYARWVQFAAFNSLMRCHGRGWENRLPWAWGLSEPGPGEGSYVQPKSEMNNPTIELIAKTYIELRYQLLPYNYTLTWEARETGMPMMRSLWLHYPTDKQASRIADQYLWGRDMLIAPVYEKGATARDVYLPEGTWYDWWTGKAVAGGKTITREVDLSTMPIYVRAGAIIPLDPVRQYTSEKVDKPTTLRIYQGADGEYTLYDDDGASLDYLKGTSSKTLITWDDAAKRLTLEPLTRQDEGKQAEREFTIELIPDGTTKAIGYAGQRLALTF
ncbi:MAG: glycoside hydrolase family 31 protein [Verrucomicrobia bacterium]|jgi:alpha-glucosidase (family GH31 glycosyl hydrolase)|nr:glycoside hydrolase family 31 protein [Verrucomicrobiota bacterium]MBT7068509.1 glycoside hydrolase family 31 protein [Verrucomicrobiota bacterium]